MGNSRSAKRNIKDPFESADITVANAQCGSRHPKVLKNCPRCELRVALHCENCRVQVTGCLCTEYKRFGNDEAWKRAVARWGEDAARQRAANAGLWVPPTH